LRLLAARLLVDSGHPRAATLLENRLKHGDSAVRVAAFEGLRKHLGASDLRPLDLALNAGYDDIGRLAVQGLEPLAQHDAQALGRLLRALGHKTADVRQAALKRL